MMDWNAIKPLLEERLDPAVVRPPSKFGPKGDYIEGWHAIAEANRIFGFGGWSYTIDMKQADVREIEKNGAAQWQAAYVCICTVTVGDVTRQDVGYGSGFAKGIGDAIEGAAKEAATDALKRALRTFGNKFGLALYDKSRENVGAPKPATISPDDLATLQEKMMFANVSDNVIMKAAKVSALADIPAAAVPAIMRRLDLTIEKITAEANTKLPDGDDVPEFLKG